MSNEKVEQLQMYEQSVNNLLLQKQQLQAQVAEMNSALKELESTSNAYKIIGNIMVSAKKEDLKKDLEAKQNAASVRLKALEKQKVIEGWKLYDWVAASEEYIKTGKPDKLKKWMKSFFIDDIIDELFEKHSDVVRKMFGSRKGVNAILGSFRKYLDYPKYKGYQK